jgi:hypothetical protein
MTQTPPPIAAEVPCPVCAFPASAVVDEDNDEFVTCLMCGIVYVTPSYAEGPTLAYPVPAADADREAWKRQARDEAPPVTDDRGQVANLGDFRPRNL